MGLISKVIACWNILPRRGGSASGEDDGEGESEPELFFALRTLQIATNFFSELNQLGHGGFGPVYKVIKVCDQIRGKVENFDSELLNFFTQSLLRGALWKLVF